MKLFHLFRLPLEVVIKLTKIYSTNHDIIGRECSCTTNGLFVIHNKAIHWQYNTRRCNRTYDILVRECIRINILIHFEKKVTVKKYLFQQTEFTAYIYENYIVTVRVQPQNFMMHPLEYIQVKHEYANNPFSNQKERIYCGYTLYTSKSSSFFNHKYGTAFDKNMANFQVTESSLKHERKIERGLHPSIPQPIVYRTVPDGMYVEEISPQDHFLTHFSLDSYLDHDCWDDILESNHMRGLYQNHKRSGEFQLIVDKESDCSASAWYDSSTGQLTSLQIKATKPIDAEVTQGTRHRFDNPNECITHKSFFQDGFLTSKVTFCQSFLIAERNFEKGNLHGKCFVSDYNSEIHGTLTIDRNRLWGPFEFVYHDVQYQGTFQLNTPLTCHPMEVIKHMLDSGSFGTISKVGLYTEENTRDGEPLFECHYDLSGTGKMDGFVVEVYRKKLKRPSYNYLSCCVQLNAYDPFAVIIKTRSGKYKNIKYLKDSNALNVRTVLEQAVLICFPFYTIPELDHILFCYLF